MSTSVATTDTNTSPSNSKPRRGGGGGSRGFRGRRGGGPTQRKPQSDPAPTESTAAADTPATPTTTTPDMLKPDTAAESTDAVPHDDGGMCRICAEPVRYYSVSECNHRTCHVCALRLRALWKRQDCTFCKEPRSSLIFTTSPTARFTSFRPGDLPYKDAKLSIFFETQEMMEDTLILLRFNCPDGGCDYVASGWDDLKLHLRAVHGMLTCDLCIRTKKIFAHEHTTYPPNILPYHLPSIQLRSLPPKPKGVDVEAHPMCEFCKECTLGEDELYAHMREKHEECFICKQKGTFHQYFKNYEALELHFTKAHHPCKQHACLEQKSVVFGTDMGLKGHMVEVHGAEMTPRDRRDIRRLEADFEYGDHGGRRRRVSGGNRDRDRDPPPQRQPPNVRRRELGTGLTDAPTPSSSTPPPPMAIPAPPPDVDPITFERYNALYARVASTAATPPRAVGAIELSLRSYRNSESTARDLISSVWNVVDQNLDSSATYINLIVDLLDEEDKKKDLLGAWNGFKIEQQGQFPELVPTSIGIEYAGIASGRVLKAKYQTTRSSRPRRQVLDRVAAAASSSSWPQPPASNFLSAGLAGAFPSVSRMSACPAISASPDPPVPVAAPAVVGGSISDLASFEVHFEDLRRFEEELSTSQGLLVLEGIRLSLQCVEARERRDAELAQELATLRRGHLQRLLERAEQQVAEVEEEDGAGDEEATADESEAVDGESEVTETVDEENIGGESGPEA